MTQANENETRAEAEWSINRVLTNAHSKFYLRCYFNKFKQNTDEAKKKNSKKMYSKKL